MKTVFDTVVVGGGLFGKVISRALAAEGHSVQCIDDHHKLRGSDPAACLMKPSWLSKLGKELEPSLELLNSLYGVQDLTFQLMPAGLSHTVHWVQPELILHPTGEDGVYYSKGTFEGFDPIEGGGYQCRWRDGDEWEERTSRSTNVIIAAGLWSSAILPQLRGRLDGRWGVAIRAPGQLECKPFIAPWAPFKQVVAFNISPTEVWCGDGSAWKDHPTDERLEKSVERELKSINGLVKDLGPHTVHVGVRPYAKTPDPCLLGEVHDNVWAATGGAKNGTAAAAWAALRLIERLT